MRYTNISESEQMPRMVIAAATGLAGIAAPGIALKAALLGSALAMFATIATGYCPINAALGAGEQDAPHWRTLKTFRVEA